MFQKLVSHNSDLARLVERGYAVAFDSGYMVVRDIPYLDANGALQWGAFVTKLKPIDQDHVIQEDHQIFFSGSIPHNLDGRPVANLGGGETTLPLSPLSADVVVRRHFSNKPVKTGAYADFFEKIESYVAQVCAPAISRYKVSPYTFQTRPDDAAPSVFKFMDSLSSRAEILDLSAKFTDDKVAVIGLGGTGSYVLDFLAKTPVKEIHGFDMDDFHVHNAFRSPGRLTEDELRQKKADVYAARYGNFRHGLHLKTKFVDASCEVDFEDVTFAFVCVDKGSSRAGIFDLLLARGIPLIDVGMGLKRKADGLRGMVRVTYYSKDDGAKVRAMQLAEMSDDPENLYRTNVQIGELNALNAALAVLRFKQLRGFYGSDVDLYHLIFDIADSKTVAKPDEDDQN